MITNNENETIELGYRLGKLLKRGDVVTLNGDLAGGKTTFTKGIGKALNVKSIVNSPTFTILKIHQGDMPLYHIDAYRLEGNSYDLGINEYEDEGVTVVEWPEYYADFLPSDYLEVFFRYIDDETREITITSHGDKYATVVKELEC